MRTETFRDAQGKWRWRRRAGNNEVVATSGEGYDNKGHALAQAEAQFPDDEHLVLEEDEDEASRARADEPPGAAGPELP
jgi:uncharacterized protein YegP (UPF0339 family)